MRRRLESRALVRLLIGCSVACGGSTSGTGPSNTPAIVNVVITSPGSLSANVGGTISLTAKVTGFGTTTFDIVTWTSSNVAVATVLGPVTNLGTAGATSDATVTCVTAGNATITASITGFDEHQTKVPGSGSTVVTCTAQTVAGVKIDTNTAKAGGTATQLHATASDAAGNPVNNASFTWTSSNASVATVSNTGLATPLSPGITTVTATSTSNTSVSGTTIFYVTGPGSCSLNPTGDVLKTTLKATVQSDPGNHAAQIGLPASLGVVDFGFSGALNTNFRSQIVVSGSSPFVTAIGGWMSTGDCAFVANGLGTFGSQQNVGVQLKGTWTNGTLNLTYTVGTNGELSGGPTVYNISG